MAVQLVASVEFQAIVARSPAAIAEGVTEIETVGADGLTSLAMSSVIAEKDASLSRTFRMHSPGFTSEGWPVIHSVST